MNSVITLAAPLRAPGNFTVAFLRCLLSVISPGPQMLSIYKYLHDFWRKLPLDIKYDHLSFLSVTGGATDHLVNHSLISYSCLDYIFISILSTLLVSKISLL